MDDTIKERILKAVERGVVARHSYFDAISLPDEQMLGRPASVDQVEALERVLSQTLPPSYRAFLLLFDGWRMVDGGTDLFSVEQLLSGEVRDAMANWQRLVGASGDEIAGRGLLIGASFITPTKYLLDPGQVNKDGEWAFVQHHQGVEAVLPSFLQWLEESVEEYEELTRAALEDDEA